MEADTDSSSFVGYQPTTTDPGWAFPAFIIVVCFLLNAFLPLLSRWPMPLEVLFGKKTTIVEEIPESNTVAAPVLRSPVNALASSDGGDDDDDDDDDDDESSAYYSASAGSVFSFSNAATVILQTGLHHHTHLKGRLAGKNKLNPRRAKSVTSPSSAAPPTGAKSEGASVKESNLAPSVDWQGGVSVAHEATKPTAVPVLEEQELDWFSQFLRVADYDDLSKRLVTITVPYTIQACTEGFFQIVNVAIIGHLLGVKEANVYVVITILVEFTATIPYGFAEAVGTLAPHAHGARNDILVGRYLQLALILYVIFTLPGIVIWSLWAYDAVRWFGFDQPTSDLAQQFVFPFLGITLLSGLNHCFNEFLDVMGHERYCTVYQVVLATFSTVSVVLAVLTGMDDIVAIGWVQFLVSFWITAGNLYIIYRNGWFDRYWGGLAKTLSLRDLRAVRVMFITAIPLSIAWVLTYGEWEVLTVFATFMGPAEVATWGLLGFVWDTFENITGGLADAAEVCVGFRMGAAQPQTAKIVAYKTIYIGVIVAVLSTSCLFLVAKYLPGWLTPDPTLQRMLFDCLPLMGFGQILMVMGTTCWGVVSAQGRVQLATLTEFISSWMFAIPLSAAFVYGARLDLTSIVAALIVGYTFGGVANGWLILRSDWAALSKIVVLRNESEGVNWDNSDWEELPPDVQEAAMFLGYTQEIWNSNKEPAISDRDWSELREDEKVAARKLGYNKAKWDDDSESDDDDSDSDDEPVSVAAAAKWPTCKWDELPPSYRKAAETLGYSKQVWNSHGARAMDDIEWDGLTQAEKDAANVLGMDKSKWVGGQKNNDFSTIDEHSNADLSTLSKEVDAIAIDPTTDMLHMIENDDEAVKEILSVTVTNYDDYSWSKLPPGVRKAAVVLGYTKKIWDKDLSPPSDDKDWNDLTREEQEAANVLGYDESKWNDDDES